MEQSDFESLVRKFTPMAMAIAREKLMDSGDAEDAVQEAFTQAYLHRHSLQDAGAFPGWFRRIVERQCYRMTRRRKLPSAPYDDGFLAAFGESLEEQVERRLEAEELRQSLASLPAKQRTAAELYYWRGYSLGEMSAFLGVSPSTLKKRLHDARRSLRRAMPVADAAAMLKELYEGGDDMLHITNGDCAAQKLRESGIGGEIVAWREAYNHGPVFADGADKDGREIRAHYLEQTLGVPREEYLSACEAQEAKLGELERFGEVVLWFEHDLYDQSMLAYLLHELARRKPESVRLSLLCIGEYPGVEPFIGLGQLSGRQLGALSGTWQPIGKEQLELGSGLWEAYASADPMRLQRLLDGDTSALPLAHDAFRAHLARFPSSRDGLGSAERAILELAREGNLAADGMFRIFTVKMQLLGMGDLQFRHILNGLAEQPEPLLAWMDGDCDSPSDRAVFREGTLALTAFGRRVLDGAANRGEGGEWDDWYGGAHVAGSRPAWLWDGQTGRLEENSAVSGKD